MEKKRYCVEAFVKAYETDYVTEYGVSSDEAQKTLRQFATDLLSWLKTGEERELPGDSGQFYTKINEQEFDVHISVPEAAEKMPVHSRNGLGYST